MRILSAVPFTGVPYGFPYGTCSIRADYVMQFWGDAMLTIGPYGSPGTCIVNCAISQFTDPGEREST